MKMHAIELKVLVALAAYCALAVGTSTAAPLVELQGSDFAGGGQVHFGSNFYGRTGVNFVYARSTGPAATMAASFQVEQLPSAPLLLVIEARDDKRPDSCRIRIAIGERQILEGPSGFRSGLWACREFAIPPDALRVGSNRLSIANLEPSGKLGEPPWFMVARCAIAEAGYSMPVIKPAAWTVRLPDAVRPLPEPLPSGRSEPGFKFRGTKGWAWTPEQYLEEVPVLAGYRMNFLMNCYLSLFTSTQAGAWKNEWWKPLPLEKKTGFVRVFQACREHGITFCFAVHPQLASPRPLDFGRAEDVDQLYQHFAWAQSQGIQWFSLSLDDVSWNTKGAAAGGADHAKLVNTIFGRLRRQDAAAQLVFCPGPYWGDGTHPEHRPYLEALGRDLHPDVYVFWTGDEVVTRRITRAAAERYQRVVQHRLFLWDNYPVNDAQPALHLGPVSGRDADLREVIDGYMSNPMASQNQINRLPLATCADYAYNPWAYDPARSIGQAILHLAQTDAQRLVLKDVIEAYPGFLVTGGGTGANSARWKFESLKGEERLRGTALEFVKHLESLTQRMAKEFPHQFEAARATVDKDIAWMKQRP